MFRPLLGHHQALWENRSKNWICYPTGPEDDLIKVETCRPGNMLFLLHIKESVLTDTLYLYVSCCFVPLSGSTGARADQVEK